MEQELEKKVREIADYFLDRDYPSVSLVNVIEKFGDDMTTLKALAVLTSGNFLKLGHIGNPKSVYGKYLALVNPETNLEMEHEVNYNIFDSHVFGSWFFEPKDGSMDDTSEEKELKQRLYEWAENGLIDIDYVWKIEENIRQNKYVCVNHRNKLFRCAECMDFSRKLKSFINSGTITQDEVEKEIFANHQQPWKRKEN